MDMWWWLRIPVWMTKKWFRHESGQPNGAQTELADFNSSNLSQAGQRYR